MSYQKEKLIAAVKLYVEPREYSDVLQHGCASGAVGALCYYSQTVAFYEEHESAIWDLIYEDMQNMGEDDNIMKFIASWNGSKHVGNMEQFKNLLCWYSVESVVRDLYNELKENHIDPEDAEAVKAFYAENAENNGQDA